MYEHVVVEHLMYCSKAPQAQQRQHSTAQHSTAHSASAKPQSKYVPMRARQSKQAHRVGESHHTSSIYTFFCGLFCDHGLDFMQMNY